MQTCSSGDSRFPGRAESLKEHTWRRVSRQGRDSGLSGGGEAVVLWMAQNLWDGAAAAGKQQPGFGGGLETHWEATSWKAAEL